MDDRQEIMAHLEELHRALIDWSRYQAKVTLPLLRADQDVRNMVLHALLVAVQASLVLAMHFIAAKKLERPATTGRLLRFFSKAVFFLPNWGKNWLNWLLFGMCWCIFTGVWI